MRILFIASEALPLIKTGGLADVAGSLPMALAGLGHDVRLLIPGYRNATPRLGAASIAAESLVLPDGTAVRLLEGTLSGSDVTVHLVDSPEHFDRPGGPYTTPDGLAWPDNAERFAVLSRAAVEIAAGRAGLDWAPDIVHCNDWQTGLVPPLLSLERTRPATVFTVHNLAYQGFFPWSTFQALALPYEFWSVSALEFYGGFSFLKGGLVYADRITTVSPTYASEICTPEFGAGLEGVLTGRGEDLVGILNGVDYEVWDPQRDPHLAQNYSAQRLQDKKPNKIELQRRLGLDEDGDVPMIGHIGRLVSQKGVDLLVEALPELLKNRVQVAILGSGEAALEASLTDAQARHPGRVGVVIGYDEALAHQIEAGVDIFAMPSRFEPCGLNQMFSLRYGTVPVVRATGGLADTVVDATEYSLARRAGTGVTFDSATPEALIIALQRALILYRQRRLWQRIQRNAMREDFSWDRSARRYVELYQTAVDERARTAATSAGGAPAGPAT